MYGQNPKFVLERFAEKPWSERLAKPVNAQVVRVDREFDDPLPPEAVNLDAVLIVLFYHDTVWLETDRARMNAAIFAALKKGGVYGVIDHSARAGTGTNDTKTLHRIEESVVTREIERAGFVLDAAADFMRNPADPRDWNASPTAAGEKRGTADRFVLQQFAAKPSVSSPCASGSLQCAHTTSACVRSPQVLWRSAIGAPRPRSSQRSPQRISAVITPMKSAPFSVSRYS